MDIVEVQFTKDSQSAETGNEFYPTGARAHFYANQAARLVDQGRVFLVTPSLVDPPLPGPDYLDDAYADFTVKMLKEEAVLRGIKVTSKMRKADLIAALKG